MKVKKSKNKDLELKPCPFCAGKRINVVKFPETLPPLYQVECRRCMVSTLMHEDLKEAAKQWSKRAKWAQ